jgi:hypothetical protein
MVVVVVVVRRRRKKKKGRSGGGGGRGAMRTAGNGEMRVAGDGGWGSAIGRRQMRMDEGRRGFVALESCQGCVNSDGLLLEPISSPRPVFRSGQANIYRAEAERLRLRAGRGGKGRGIWNHGSSSNKTTA